MQNLESMGVMGTRTATCRTKFGTVQKARQRLHLNVKDLHYLGDNAV
jgi:hypothetical protein